jgi:hypothetical protein
MLVRAIGIAVLGLAAPALAATAPTPRTSSAAHPKPIQEGLYEGTGRACGGTLRISRNDLTWRSPFSQCSGPTVLIDRQSKGEATRWAYRLGKPHKQCLYKVVVIEQVETPDAGPWNVIGYPSLDAYKADAADARLGCYLVKVR